MTSPRLTVVVATWNRPRLLARALESVASQREIDLADIQVVVVDDAGEDPSRVVESFTQRLDVTLLRHATNRGRSATRNTGIAAATGEYVAFLDDDDVLGPDHVSRLLRAADAAADNGEPVVVYSRAELVHEDQAGVVHDRNPLPAPGWSRARLLVYNFIPIHTVIAPRAVLQEIGGFDEALEVLEDWELWLRLSALVPFRHLPVVTCEVRHRLGLDNSTTRERSEHIAQMATVYEMHPAPEHGIQRARQMHLAQSVSVGPAFERSILLIAADDDSLLAQLQAVGCALDGQPDDWEIVAHVPQTDEVVKLTRQVEGDVTFVFADPSAEWDEDAAWSALARRAAGRRHVRWPTDGSRLSQVA